ncbi:putative interleukin-17 receptor E-like isoform X3 [Bufo gargarizans]|uniref:putative interleukin-17 receptor E-like isoform X3 n=1 Tax=Bufo gargarizans TaxID=30331 RepID=UPI001CF44953|nr:putative interleukin-17 receptor E-like isoform X3 [Bufo gargarizans]
MSFNNRKCCFLHWKSSGSHFLMIVFFGIANCHSIRTIQDCGIQCSQGLNCKSKPTYNIRGVEICTLSPSSQQNQCMNIRFIKNKVKKSKHKVQVHANCFEVGVSEHVFVTMKTVPDYCGIEISKEYHVEGCHNKDVGKYILPCLTGRLDYMINEEKKNIIVSVSNNPEDYDYNVRLCLKKISCHDTGAHARIKKDNSTKSVTLAYSEILPCLCIEGWPIFPDARRTRLCPFENDKKIWQHYKKRKKKERRVQAQRARLLPNVHKQQTAIHPCG